MMYPVQGVSKTPQTIENGLLLEFQCLALNLNVRVHKSLTKYFHNEAFR